MINGIGTIFYGRRNYVPDGEWETLDTTKWFACFWFPVLPLGSYTIRRERRRDIISSMARNLSWEETVYILARRPLDLTQVLATYLKAYVPVAFVVLWGSR